MWIIPVNKGDKASEEFELMHGLCMYLMCMELANKKSLTNEAVLHSLFISYWL